MSGIVDGQDKEQLVEEMKKMPTVADGKKRSLTPADV